MAKTKEAAAEPMDGEMLPDGWKKAQAQATMPRPKPVKLARRKADPDGPDPGPPLPPAAGDGPLPRVVHQNERAPRPGQAPFRFKVRCVNYGGQEWRYVLARSESEAVEHYAKAVGLPAVLSLAKAELGDRAPAPVMSVKQLAD